MDPHDRLACSRLRATLQACSCASRHVLRLPSGGGRGFPRFPGCAACPVGAVVLARLEAAGWQRPPDTIPADIPDPEQRRARDRWRRSFPGYREPAPADDRDPLREVAGWTPEDRGAGMDVG